MDRTTFFAPGPLGDLGGWVAGDGPPVLMLHGGPGISYNLDGAGEELLSTAVGVLVGAESPIPPKEAGLASADRVPGAWGISVPGAGHFVWVERPGCVAAAMSRLSAPA